MRKKLLIFGGFLIAVLLAAALLLFFVQRTVLLEGPLAVKTHVVIPKGASVKSIATILEREGVINHPTIFVLWARFTGLNQKLKAGEYEFNPGIDQGAVMEKLVSHVTVDHFITIPEGLTSAEIVTLLNEKDLLNGNIINIPLEGSLLPETYHFDRGDQRRKIIAKMAKTRDELLDKLWNARAENLPFKSKEEALVLASIVEKETGVTDERAKVAGVFINRLRIGMRLQSDPTVAYAVMDGSGKMTRPLSRADLKLNHPFNTYVIKGLPPAPIANPGRAAIEAVLQPEKTKALYFVADGTGGHAFGNSLVEHNRNVAKWRKIQKQKKN